MNLKGEDGAEAGTIDLTTTADDIPNAPILIVAQDVRIPTATACQCLQ